MATSRDSRRQDERKDTMTLVSATSLLAAFAASVIDLRLCAMVAAFGVFWILVLKHRFRQAPEGPGER
jgi:hypothetical protein